MKTGFWLVLLLLASWALEMLLGVQCVRWYWQCPLPGSASLALTVAQAGNGLLGYIHTSQTVPVRHTSAAWTAASVTNAMITAYLWLHVVWAVLSLLGPMYQRLKLGARRPSQREVQQLETALAALTRARPGVVRPRRFLVADGPGVRIRWIGYVLVVDRALLQHRHLRALLAHELGHINQEDRIARRLAGMMPTARAMLFALAGLPFGLAALVFYPLWAAYWRARIFAADRYAVSLGQGQALSKALNDLYLPLDRVTRFGRWMQTIPYVETRIGRIQRAMARFVPAGSTI
jgi:Zn-dependent protease with chaperone function